MWFANAAGLKPDAAYEVGDGGPSMSPAQLSDLFERFESEEIEIRELLALVDARLADYSPAVSI
jgi:CDP-glycerol glycerophosphotransferase (TagB/SpsB family)